MGVRRAHVPKLPGKSKKTGVDDYQKKKGVNATKKMLEEAANTPLDPKRRGGTPILRPFAAIKQKEVTWLWYRRIPFGMLSAICGNPGGGKSLMAMHVAARGSVGLQPGPENAKCEPFSTLYMSNENSHEHTSKPRLLAMGADEARIHALDGVVRDGATCSVTLDDIDVIEQAIKETGARLLIIDPLQSYIPDVDFHRANETRAKLDPLIKLAERTGVAVLIISHVAKSSGGRGIHGMLGSIDIVGAMRSVMMIGTPPDNREERALLLVKSSVGPWDETLGFKIVPEGNGVVVKWTGPSDLSYADMIAPEKQQKLRATTKKEELAAWLRAELADGAWHYKGDLLARSKANARTLESAAKGVVESRKEPKKKNGKYQWRLRPKKKFETERNITTKGERA